MNKHIRIAFTGVFDLANYGDHLFPEIFKTQLSRRGVDCELVLFSVFSCHQAFNPLVPVHSIHELETLHKENPFDAVVIGGGEIIHFNLFQHSMDHHYIDYPIYELWTLPSLFAMHHQIRVLWNTPGIPFDFDGVYRLFAKELLRGTEYLSVRNDCSKSALEKLGFSPDEISLVPDSAFLLNETFSPQPVSSLDLGLSDSERYAVVHISKLTPVSDLPIVASELEKLAQAGYTIVLLPLAYTNEDDKFQKSFAETLSIPSVTIEQQLTLEETVSVIAHSALYIGYSFHGAITAFVYGVKAISYNYTYNRKTSDLFQMIGRPEYHTETANQLSGAITMALSDNRPFSEQKETICKSLKTHFDTMTRKLSEPVNERLAYTEEQIQKLFSSLIGRLSTDRQATNARHQEALQNQASYIHALEEASNSQQAYIDNLTAASASQQAYIRNLEQDLHSCQSHIDALAAQIRDLNERLASSDTQTASLRTELQASNRDLESLKNSTSWKLTKPLRAIRHNNK